MDLDKSHFYQKLDKSRCVEQKLKQLGIVGISLRETQNPAGKMKFTVIFIGVMLLRGIELHRHRNRHGHNEQMTDPQREIDEFNEIDKAVDKEQTVDATEVQKDVRSNPHNTDEYVAKVLGTDLIQEAPGTKMAQDKL